MPRPEGPFERLLRRKPERDPAPIIIGGTIAFLALVIVLVFVFSSVTGGGSSINNSGGSSSTRQIAPGVTSHQLQIPALPPGLVAFSDYYQLTADKETAASIGLQLKEKVQDATGLGFYTYSETRWQRLADVAKIEQGGRVAFADFRSVPQNVAVLKVMAQTYQVAASLPAGGSLHSEAHAAMVSPRDYAPVDDGSVRGTTTDVKRNPAYLIMPTIVGSGQDTAAVVNHLLGDDKLRDQHAKAVISMVEKGGFDGIDLEYSAVDPNLKDQLTSFVKQVADGLHGKNKKLSITAPPPGKQRQAYDWKELGKSVDYIKVLPIANPVTYWESMPDALGQIEQSVESRKVLLVMSPFAIEDLGDTQRPMGYQAAMALAGDAVVRDPQDPKAIKPGTTVKLVARNLDSGEGASPMAWNDEAAAVSFAVGGNQRRRIYIENSYSFRFKLEMVQAYALGGVAVSDGSAQSDVADIWPALKDFLNSATIDLSRPNESSLAPTWASPDGGDLGAGAGTTATWVAPKAGDYNIVLIVSDGERRFGLKTKVTVNKAEQPSATPIQTFAPESPSPTPSTSAVPSATQSATPTPTPKPTSLPAPTNLSASLGPGNTKATLTWDKYTAAGVDHIDIWLAKSTCGLGTHNLKVASVAASTTEYIDTGLSPSTLYCYVIDAVDKYGNESPASNEAPVTTGP